MSRLHSVAPVEVRIGDCACPGEPHPDGDIAKLRPRLLPGDAMAVLAVMGEAEDATEAHKGIGMAFLRGGLVAWNILDDDGQPIPVSAFDSGGLDWDETLRPIADAAADLYTESLLRPLVKRRGKSSRRGQTDASTSPKSKSS